MSQVIIAGDTSGTITLQAPAVSGSTTLTLPATTGNVLTSTTQLIGTGTTTNNDASAGYVGEFIDSTATNVTVATTATNLTSISLTAGDWDVSGIVQFYGGGAVTYVVGAINTTSASFSGTAVGKNQIVSATNAANGLGSATLPRLRFSLASTTTIYLIGALSASQQCYGYISARRIR
jgi:hypothetical protein